MPSRTPGAEGAESSAEWEVLARYVSGECSDAERGEVERRLAANPADARLVAELQSAMGMLRTPVGVDVERALGRVNAIRAREGATAKPSLRLERAGTIRRTRSWGAYAAAAAAVIAIGALAWQTTRSDEGSAARTVATAAGARDSVLLPDGTRVLLGPGSEITIAANYGKPVRGVSIRGEAYFDVRHEDSPFIVAAGNAAIRDIGTAFVVRAEPTGSVTVTVTTGSVEVKSTADTGRAEVLGAGDVAQVSSAGVLSAARGAGTDEALAWTRGRLVFKDAPMSQVRSDLRRWYGVVLDVQDSSVLAMPLTDTFEGDSIEQVLNRIQLALGVTIERRGDTAVVRPSKR